MERGEIKANQPYLPTKLFLHADETKQQTTEQNTSGCPGQTITEQEHCRASPANLTLRHCWSSSVHPDRGQVLPSPTSPHHEGMTPPTARAIPPAADSSTWLAAGTWFRAQGALTALGGHWAPLQGGTGARSSSFCPKCSDGCSSLRQGGLDWMLPRAVVEGFNRPVDVVLRDRVCWCL